MSRQSRYKQSVRHVVALRRLAKAAGLAADERFWDADPPVLAECYNGIGPDRWSGYFRRLVTDLLEWFEADALIHDWDYTFRPKTYGEFARANCRFVLNAWRLARFERPDSLRYAIAKTRRAILLAAVCQAFGWRGYKQGAPPKMCKLIISIAIVAVLSGATGCTAAQKAWDNVKAYDWSSWLSTHEDKIVEVVKGAEGSTDAAESEAAK